MEAVGIYSMAYRFFIPLNVLADATNTAFIPTYNKLRKQGSIDEIIKNIKYTLKVNIIFYAVFMFFAPIAMKMMLTEEYYSAIKLIPFIGLTFIGKTIYHIQISEVYYQIKINYMAVLTLGNVFINSLICILLVKSYQGVGVCIAYSISSLCLALMAIIYKYKISNFNLFSNETIIYFSVSIIITVLSYFLSLFIV
jgi:O-antigen/teichoic acid export membrane protein